MINNKAYIVVLLFVAWSLFSWNWYTCGIKGFCATKSASVPSSAVADFVPTSANTHSDSAVTSNQDKTVDIKCDAYITSYIRRNKVNDNKDVMRLETFLNQHEGESLQVDGVYGPDDELAVRRFQQKYRAYVLDPWHIDAPTGYVYTTTRNHINKLYCESVNVKITD